MKSSADVLETRGFIDEKSVSAEDYSDNVSLIEQLKSDESAARTRAAIIIRRRAAAELIPELIAALKSESKLYSKIEISNALISFGESSVGPLIGCLGEIGNNQHRALPGKPFGKDSYPLPRDIAARILVNIGEPVIDPLMAAELTSGQMREAVDVLGHISFYSDDKRALPFLINCYADNSGDKVLRWKLIRALSAFENEESLLLLNTIVSDSRIDAFVWEAERSLRLISSRAEKG